MDYALCIDDIRAKNFNKKLCDELEYWNVNGSINVFTNKDFDIGARKMTLESLIDTATKEMNPVQTQKDNIFKEFDKYTYKKQWNRLLSFHKIQKIKEYMDANIENEKMRTEIIETMTNLVSEGKINTKKYVIYDRSAEKIISVPCLVLNGDKFVIKYI